MTLSASIRGLALGIVCFWSALATAQDRPFEMKSYNYNEFSKGTFSEAVTVTGPAKFVFLAGIGAEKEDGSVGFPGDFMGQCVMAYEKIKKILAANGASIDDMVNSTTYLMDIRSRDALMECRRKTFPSTKRPPGTLLEISKLARPGMLIEIEMTAAVAAK